ncbi:MAG: hypothetical protein KGJ60_07535 [Verrucomicrobiota bacterium]|nr:hypothetical protein [Verrucomicrobiota bacterium]
MKNGTGISRCCDLSLTPGFSPVPNEENLPSRFSGLKCVSHLPADEKRLKPFLPFHAPITRLKPGVNERERGEFVLIREIRVSK